ncbi:MAG: class I SAM-dependent methyltransferase [Candidatus Heimdallarchaeota archaeon]|nr:class I SAM-dependent methyltransferase [Candidatus Heimdallarchaeota archaeon]
MKNADVATPNQWLNGWDNFYNRENDQQDLSYPDYMVNPRVQQYAVMMAMMDRKNQKILEFGCGSGREACFLAKQGHEITGMDALAKGILVAKKRAEQFDIEDKLHFEVADMASYKVQDEIFDAIISIQSLQYIFDDVIPKLEEIRDKLKDGGFFVYSGNILPHFPTDPPIRFVTKDELLDIFAGWTIHSISEERRLMKPGDERGYVTLIVQKPEKN